MDKEREAVLFFISKGWTPEQAVGIVGNLKKESGLDVNIIGDDGQATGIAQWHPDRYKLLQQQYGDKANDFYNQLNFVNWELNNTEKKSGDLLRNSKGVWEAGQIVSDNYERPKTRFNLDEARQTHVSDTARKFKGITLTDDDKKRFSSVGEVTYANSVAPYITSSVSDLHNLEPKGNFESVPDVYKEPEKEEVSQAKEELNQKDKEYNFLKELNNLRGQQAEQVNAQQQEEDQPQQELPQETTQEIYNNVSQFVDTPVEIAQQGMRVNNNLSLKDINTLRGLLAQGTFNNSGEKNTKVVSGLNVPTTFEEEFHVIPRLTITDDRTINATTGKAINPNKDLVSGNYNQKTVDDIISAAKRNGVDPYTALSVGLQESKLGTTDFNIGHVRGSQNINLSGDPVEDFVKILKDKIDYGKKLGYKDEAQVLQTYNGLGIVAPRTEKHYHGYEMNSIKDSLSYLFPLQV